MEGLKQLGSFNTVEASINGELDNPKLSRCRWSGGVSSKWCDANRPLFCWWFGTWILRLSIQLGMSSSQLTKSIIFQRGRLNHQLVLVFYKFTEENETYPVIITVFTRFNPPKKGGTWCSDCQTRPCIIQIWVISAYLCLNCWSPTFHKCFFHKMTIFSWVHLYPLLYPSQIHMIWAARPSQIRFFFEITKKVHPDVQVPAYDLSWLYNVVYIYN